VVGARQQTQGATELEEFGVELDSDAVGTTFPFHRVEPGETPTMGASIAPVFFQSHNIALAPNEIYEAKLEVSADISKELEYGFVITGNTAHGTFSYRPMSYFKLVGYRFLGHQFAHEYWTLPQQLGGPCWMPVHITDMEPRCP